VTDDVPIKLIAADHHTGLIPLDAANPNGDALLIRGSALLDLLYTLFDTLWERATPVTFNRRGRLKIKNRAAGGEDDSASGDGPGDSEHLVAMLAAGLKDEAIAHQLGLSSRTLDRRIARLMRGLGAHTRFQAGWLARPTDPEPTTEAPSD
jgi:Response regulator containing a CheY-like receiver domain and an HTH DNA-binding domain